MQITGNLGALIKETRDHKGITQESLAEKAGISVRHIQAIENERKGLSVDVLIKLALELNLSLDDIFLPDEKSEDDPIDHLTKLLRRCNNREIMAITALTELLLFPK